MEPRIDELEVDPVPVVAGANADAIVASAWMSLSPELFGFLARSTRDEQAAEDLLQEAFLRLTTEVRRGRVPGNIRAWLYRVSSNLVISRGRRATTAIRWMSRYGAVEAFSTAASPEVDVLRLERSRAMERALGRLSTVARVAITLSGAGFSGRDIAATIGRTDSATRTLLARARIALRRDLAAEEAE